MAYRPFLDNVWSEDNQNTLKQLGLDTGIAGINYGMNLWANKLWEKEYKKQMGEELEFNDVVSDSNAIRSSAFNAAKMFDPNASYVLSTLGATLYDNYNKPTYQPFTPVSYFGNGRRLTTPSNGSTTSSTSNGITIGYLGE